MPMVTCASFVGQPILAGVPSGDGFPAGAGGDRRLTHGAKKPPYSYSVGKNWAGFPIGLWGAGMGVWGKGAAVEPPCPSQHCRDQAAQAARPLPTPVIEIHSHVAIISSRGSPGRITIRWAGLPLRRVKPPDIRCLPSVSRAAGAALFPKRTLRCRPETMTTLL